MKTVDIVERIEGEAKLVCQWDNSIITDARIEFLNFRGFEYILENKAPLDALVYTPRICGICGQAHLKATVEALEDIYINSGNRLNITNKAKLLREIGLNIEMIDSHIKWFYMFIMPDMTKLSKNDFSEYEPLKGQKWLKGLSIASETIKALAIIGGQWPHTSYMIPGGVVSDPTLFDLTTMNNYLDSAIKFYEDSFTGVEFDTFLGFSKAEDIFKIRGDLKDFIDISFEQGFDKFGRSYDRHLVLTESELFRRGKVNKRLTNKIDFERINESDEFTLNIDKNIQNSEAYTWSKNVKYGDNFYETGPLSRAVVSKREFIVALHDQYKDSVLTRVVARMDELAHILNLTKKMIRKLDLSEESAIKVKHQLSSMDGVSGLASVEASRGSLYHNVTISEGKIGRYEIITPTVWNLGPGSLINPSIAQKAIIGLDSIEKAQIVLRSFDVCSVCTTH